MNQPQGSIWALKRNDLTTSSDIGVVIINWKDAPDSKIKEIISSLYKDNADVISGMSYKEYDREAVEDLIKKIPAFLEGKYVLCEKKEKFTQKTLF